MDSDKRTRVVRAVMETVCGEGLPALSMGRIAARAGVSVATPYVYFRDKEDMLARVYLECREAMDAGLERTVEGGASPAERLERVAMHYARAFRRDPVAARFRILMREERDRFPQDVRERAVATSKPVADLLRELRDSGAIDRSLPSSVVDALLFAPGVWLLLKAPRGTVPPLSAFRSAARRSVAALLNTMGSRT